MKILFFCSTWGMQTPSLEASLAKIKQAGFDGVEMGVPGSEAACAHARRALDEAGLALVVQQWTRGPTPGAHADSFQEQYERAVSLKPLHVNSHTGRDCFSLDENLAVFDRAAELEHAASVPVLHETHRGRALYSTRTALGLMNARPQLRLTADFSHWCCVHESLLEDQRAAVEQAVDRSYYIHARVGHSQGPQITDPRDPKWQPEIAAHMAWWQKIVEGRRKESCPVLGICPEFGPPPYMTVLPHSQQPVAELWEINCYMRDMMKSTC